MGLALKVSHVFEKMADETAALDALGPAEYINDKVTEFSPKVSKTVGSVRNWIEKRTTFSVYEYSDIDGKRVLTGKLTVWKPISYILVDAVCDAAENVYSTFGKIRIKVNDVFRRSL